MVKVDFMATNSDSPVTTAIAPGAFVFVIEGLFWAFAAATGWGGVIGLGGLVLVGGVIAGIVAPPLIATRREKDWALWAVVSVSVSALGLFFGFVFWLEAMSVGCAGSCLD